MIEKHHNPAASIGQIFVGTNATQAQRARMQKGSQADMRNEKSFIYTNESIAMKNIWNAIVTNANKEIAVLYFSTSAFDRVICYRQVLA